MQMGRWFGYRRNYDDLFRIWIGEDSASWYAEIAAATTQLKKDMNDMRRHEMKPREFGIRVRDDSDRLQITARNKMRNAQTEYEWHSFYGNYMETPYLSANAAIHRQNFAQVCRLIQNGINAGLELRLSRSDRGAERYIMHDVPKAMILQLLRQVDVTRYNRDFDTKQITEFLCTCQDLALWDVAFISGAKTGKPFSVCGITIWGTVRNECTLKDDKLQIGLHSRLAGARDGIVGLKPEQIELAKSLFQQDYMRETGVPYTGSSYASSTWFKYITDRNPLLTIYLVEANGNSNQDETFAKFKTALGENTPVVGFSIGIPETTLPVDAEKCRYKANRYQA